MIAWWVGCAEPAEEIETPDTNWGTVTAERAGESGDLIAASAWGYDDGAKALLFFPSVPGISCERVVTQLAGPSGNPDWDPGTVLASGTCDLFMFITYEGGAADWTDDLVNATVTLNCAFDTGEWAGGEYTGPYWQGSPHAFQVTAGGGNGGDFDVSVTMDEYEGNFVYDDMLDAPASGPVTGQGVAGWCPELGTGTPFF